MNIKKTYIILDLSVLTLSALIGCSKPADNSSIIPTMSESLQAIEIPEPEPIKEPEDTTGANGSQGSIDGIGDSEFVEGTALTQEEIDELKANATTDMAKRGVDAYEEYIKTGQCDLYGDGIIATEVIGKPGDTSWRQMTDEEAQAALDKNINDIIAKAELSAGTWNKYWDGKVYFNPYEYYNAMLADVESTPDVIHDFE